MGRKALTTVGVLIGMYLVAAHATGWGKLMLNAGTAGGGLVKNLQGR
jgi:hypothetical protein